MSNIAGTNTSDFLTGTATNDVVNSGNGDDTVEAGAGNDQVNGGAGNDTLDGGSGSDQLSGGSGSDTLIYNISENSGAATKDIYTGGSGSDTVVLEFTREQWLDSANQIQIANYLSHLQAVTNAKTGEVSNASASDFVFTFGTSTLTVQMNEALRVVVDGVELNPADEVVQTLADVELTTEEGPAVNIHVLANDLVPDLVKNLSVASEPEHGTAVLVQPDLGNPATWYFNYQADPAHFQYLGEGQSATDTFTYTVVDADGDTSTATVTVTINGTNDVPVIGGVATKSVNEDSASPNLTASGTLTIADVDAGQSSFVAQNGTAGSNQYGSFTVDATGNWTYTANNSQSAIQQLGVGQSLTDSFTVVSQDGTASQVVTVTINGTNDVPVIGGVATKSVSEDAASPNLTASGTLTIADVDAGQSSFVAQNGTAGSNNYGNFTVDASGNWSYVANNSQQAIQQLGAGQSLTDSFTVVSQDGTASQVVTVTINGTNDVPVIGGVATKSVTEDAASPNLTASGTLTIADVDAGQSSFVAQSGTAGSNQYGLFTVDATGNWTYTANNSQLAIQQLGVGQSLTDSFTVVSQDGTASQIITITINGTNDVPVIGGVATKAVNEDSASPTLTASGTLTIADVDAGQSSFVAQNGTAGSNHYGSFTVDATGNWTYAANNSQQAIQQLGAGQSLTDSFTVVSQDGTASQVVTVTINGTNDVPVIGGMVRIMTNEDQVITGKLGATTSETNDTLTFGIVSGPARGVLELDSDGSYRYTPDLGNFFSDSFTYFVNDGNGGIVNGTAAINIARDSTEQTVASGVIYLNDAPEVAATANGGHVVVWTVPSAISENISDIYLQRYDATGNKIGDAELVNSTVLSFQKSPSVAAAGDGFVVTWTSLFQDGSSDGIFAQRYDANGSKIGGEVLINQQTFGPQSESNVGELADGGYVVTWEGYDGNNAHSIFARVYSAQGIAQTGEFVVNTSSGFQKTQGGLTESVAGLDNGRFVVTWTEGSGSDGSSYGVFARVFNRDGSALTSEFRVNTATANQQTYASVGAVGNDFVVTWSSYEQDGSGWGVFAQRYDGSGAPLGTEFQVNTHTLSNQMLSNISELSDGGFVIAWESQSDRGIVGQRYDASGHTIGGEFMISDFHSSTAPSLTLRDDGALVAVWESGSQVKQTIIASYEGGNVNAKSLTGSAANDSFIGSAKADTLSGAGGDDRLEGLGGADFLSGGTGADTFVFGSPLGTGNVDTINDFVSGVDAIYLENASGSPFDPLPDGALAVAALDIAGDSTAASTATRIVYDPATGALYYDADGSGSGGAVQFATLTNKPAMLAASDFLIGS